MGGSKALLSPFFCYFSYLAEAQDGDSQAKGLVYFLLSILWTPTASSYRERALDKFDL